MAYDSENYVVTDLPEPPTVSPEEETRQILTKARDLIKRGWCKGEEHVQTVGFFGGVKDQYCIIGALKEASKHTDTHWSKLPATHRLLHHLGYTPLPYFNYGFGVLSSFNDVDARKSDVLKLFDDTLKEQA